MKVQFGRGRDGVPEFGDEFGIEIADLGGGYRRMPNPVSPPRQIDRAGNERLVHRQKRMPVAPDPGFIAERAFDRRPEANADVFGRVVRIDVKISEASHVEVEQRVPGE